MGEVLGARVPPTVDRLASSMDVDAVSVLPYDIESTSCFSASCTLSVKENAMFLFFGGWN